MKPLLLSVAIPDYKPGKEPNHKAVGKELDQLLVENFLGKDIVIRCIGSQDHPKLSLDGLTKTVIETGTDKYDTTRMGVGYEEFIKKGVRVDFYGEETKVTESTDVMSQQIWEMYHSAIGDRGYGVHVDLILVYDRTQLDMVMNLYSHHPTSDGYVFKNPARKPECLLGVIKVVS